MFAGLRSFIASIIIGVVFIGGGAFTLFMVNADAGDYANLAKNGVKVAGQVSTVSYENSTTGTGSKRKTKTYEKVTISYDVQGRTYTINKKEIRSGADARVGDKVNILADKSDPAKAQVERTDGNGTAGGRIVGIIFIVVGLFLLANSGIALLRGIVFNP